MNLSELAQQKLSLVSEISAKINQTEKDLKICSPFFKFIFICKSESLKELAKHYCLMWDNKAKRLCFIIYSTPLIANSYKDKNIIYYRNFIETPSNTRIEFGKYLDEFINEITKLIKKDSKGTIVINSADNKNPQSLFLMPLICENCNRIVEELNRDWCYDCCEYWQNKV